MLQATHALGQQIYGLQDAGVELLRPLHGVHSPHLASFQQITQNVATKQHIAVNQDEVFSEMVTGAQQ
jgi:hypothetical protein